MSSPLLSDSKRPFWADTTNRLIGVGLLTRLLIDTAVQLFFPFLPVIARGLNISTVAAGQLVSLRGSMGLLSPLFGELAERIGYRRVMRIGLLLGATGYAIIAIGANLTSAIVGMVLAGLGIFSFTPTLQAYLSNQLPLKRRARGLGTLEYAWALAGIVGLSLFGLLIEATSWRAPFVVLSAGLFVAAVGYQWLPMSKQLPTSPTAVHQGAANGRFFDLGPTKRSAWSSILSQGMVMFAAMNLFITYGTWFADQFNYAPSDLGRLALYLGIADLCGSVIVSSIGDWLGIRRSVLGGIMLSILGYLLLPSLSTQIGTAVVGILLVRFTFEFSVVSNIALLSEQSPNKRAKVMTLAAASALTGATIAGFTGPRLYDQIGVAGIAWTSGAVAALALALVWWRVNEAQSAD